MSDDTAKTDPQHRPAGGGPVEHIVGRLVAYEMDDEPTIYAATSAVHAANLYAEDTGALPEDGYPRELTATELNAELPDRDEDERITGRMTSIRAMLNAQAEPGPLASSL